MMSVLTAVLLIATAAAEGKPDAARSPAGRVAAATPHAARAKVALEEEIAAIEDQHVRATVQAQVAATSLPGGMFAADGAKAEAALRAAGFLDAPLPFSAEADSFWAAPGGPCPDGHHSYPGGLGVHSLANLRHAVALARIYRDVYGVELNEDWLRAAAAWHDSGKAFTLRWTALTGSCGHEPKIAGTAAHHALGVAMAIARKLPPPLVVVIASSHAPPSPDNVQRVCGWLKAGSILATGKPDAVACPTDAAPAPLEAFVNNSGDSDFHLTGMAAQRALMRRPGGWERFDPLRTASELQLWK